jgi:hypothetical protein
MVKGERYPLSLSATAPLCTNSVQHEQSRRLPVWIMFDAIFRASRTGSGRLGFLFFQRVRTQFLDLSGEGRHHLRKFGCFGRRHPSGSKPIGIDSKVFKHNLRHLLPRICLLITFQVMTFAEVSTNHQNTIRSFVQGADHHIRTYHSGTHYSHYPQVRRILHTTDPSQVSSGVCSPRAQKP